jgi:hypothetical protein
MPLGSDRGTAETPGRDPAGIDITAADPPGEVLDQMARLTAINNRLRDRGYELTFSLTADGCQLDIELRDRRGQLLRRLSVDEASEIVSGDSIDQV